MAAKVIDHPHAPAAAADTPGTRILRLPEVVRRIGLSKPTIWRLVKAGLFPAPIHLSANARGWDERAIEQWIDERARSR